MRSLFMSRLALGFAMISSGVARVARSIGATAPELMFEPSPSVGFKFKYKSTAPSYNRVSQKKRRLYKRRLAK